LEIGVVRSASPICREDQQNKQKFPRNGIPRLEIEAVFRAARLSIIREPLALFERKEIGSMDFIETKENYELY
jgi:hypothetical protein